MLKRAENGLNEFTSLNFRQPASGRIIIGFKVVLCGQYQFVFSLTSEMLISPLVVSLDIYESTYCVYLHKIAGIQGQGRVGGIHGWASCWSEMMFARVSS